jgi:hypothetical protein
VTQVHKVFQVLRATLVRQALRVLREIPERLVLRLLFLALVELLVLSGLQGLKALLG